MLNNSRPTEPPVVVVGAGIAGLSTALTVSRHGRPVVVLDAHEPGGRARTAVHDGVLHNTGPHALYLAGALAGLLRTHGISFTGGTPGADGLTVVRGGVPTRISMRPLDLLHTPVLGRRERVRLLGLLARVQRADPERFVGRSVDDWLQDVPLRVRQFVDMLIRVGTYTEAPEDFDAGAAIAQLQIAIAPGVRYIDGGWGSMVSDMCRVLAERGVEIRRGAEVTAVTTDCGTVTVEAAGGSIEAGAAVIATGGPDVAQRLTGRRPAGTDRLTGPVTVSALDLVLDQPTTTLALSLDEPMYLSAHAPVAQLTPDGRGLVSVQHYHRQDEELPGPQVERQRLLAWARRVGVAPDHVVGERYWHRLVVSHGAPTAAGGGLRGRPTVEALALPGVLIAGDWVGPTGLIGDAAAASGEAAGHLAAQARRASMRP